MLKHAPDLSADHEYFIIWAGGVNARPWGAKSDAYDLFPEFEHAVDGLTITLALNTDGPHTTGNTSTPSMTIGSTVSVDKNEFAGSTVRMGTNTALTLGYGVIVSHAAIAVGNTIGAVTISWTIGSGSTGEFDAAYIVREGRKWGSYPNVRVLTPYQPVEQEDSLTEATLAYPLVGNTFANLGRAITLPAPFSGTTTSTLFSDLGVFLPLTFHEGINGFGISEQDDSTGSVVTHTISEIATSGTVWTFGNALSAIDLLNGGYVILDWEDSGEMKRSWAPINDSTTVSFTTGTWLGDGAPTDGTGSPYSLVKRYTAWVPYFDDNPFAYLPGEGYTYPNHDMMPSSDGTIGANVHCRPRGITGNAYADTFGAMLVTASRLSAAIGHRVNVINLGVTDSLLIPSKQRNGSGFDGTLGWWDHDDHATWAPGDTTSIYARLKKLIQTVLPNALLAESSTKTPRCLGIVFAHGEADALETGARQNYARALQQFVTGLRTLITDKLDTNSVSFNPYANGAEIPFIHPRIAYLPNAIDGTYDRDADRGGGTVTINADVSNLVNAAIEQVTAADEFAASVKVDDLPRLTADPGIYSGVGEAELGARTGDQLARLVDHGLGFGSTALATAQTDIVDVCNIALAEIGSAPLTSLTDGSVAAGRCNTFLPTCRKNLLQLRQWGFAHRRRQLVSIQMPEPGLFQHWKYCYVMPEEALNAFEVVAPVDEPTSEDFDYEAVTTAAYQTTFVADDGSGTKPSGTVPTPPVQVFHGVGGGSGVVVETDQLLPILSGDHLNPRPYSVEQSTDGHRLIFTNQKHATLQYVANVVDATKYSSQFRSALSAYLASMLASVTIKGDAGEAVSLRMLKKANGYAALASSSDANQQRSVKRLRPFGFQPAHLEARDGVDQTERTGAGDSLDYYPSSGFRVL